MQDNMKDVYPLIENGKINYARAYGVLSGLFIALEVGTYTKEQAIEQYNEIWHLINNQEDRENISRN
jgi:hypothetical protein